MIYEAIADAEGLQPTEDDLKDVFGDNYDLALETYGGTAYPMHQLRIDNGYNFVMENATVADCRSIPCNNKAARRKFSGGRLLLLFVRRAQFSSTRASWARS